MKKVKGKLWLAFLLGLATIALFTQCEDEDVTPAPIFVVTQNGYSRFNQNALRNQLNALPKEDLSPGEISGLLFMREEEKLAQDIYWKLHEHWNNQVFDNIAESEATHADAVLLLLEKYDLADPVGNNGVGIFVNPDLQALYDNLLARGNQSELEALQVGAAVEEIDIIDLEQQLLDVVNNQDIALVYENLQRGSRNHLRAFVRNLALRDFSYEPAYLDREAYDDIILGDMETGNGPN